MTSRERVRMALDHKEADRVPYFARLHPILKEKVMDVIPAETDPFLYYGADIMMLTHGFAEFGKYTPDNLPMPTPEDLETDKKMVEYYHGLEKATISQYVPGVYEHVKEFLTDEEALAMMYEDPDELKEIIRKVGEWRVEIAKFHAAAGNDIVYIGDDIGAQRSLIMSPDCYYEFYKPWHEAIVKGIKEVNPEAKVAFHCCGHVMPLIPDLIEIGVDIVESVQPEAFNDLPKIKELYGDKISFWGAVGMQSVLSENPPEYVMQMVKETLDIMKTGGGYVCAPCHMITEDMTVENVEAFFKAAKEYGAY